MVDKKSVIFLVVLGSLSVYVTLYTATAHKVARYVYEEDGNFFLGGRSERFVLSMAKRTRYASDAYASE